MNLELYYQWTDAVGVYRETATNEHCVEVMSEDSNYWCISNVKNLAEYMKNTYLLTYSMEQSPSWEANQ